MAAVSDALHAQHPGAHPKAQPPALGRAGRAGRDAPGDRGYVGGAGENGVRSHGGSGAADPGQRAGGCPGDRRVPGTVRVRLRTTHGVARLNAEIRRRERVIRMFPHKA